jgi:hypothetical protein
MPTDVLVGEQLRQSLDAAATHSGLRKLGLDGRSFFCRDGLLEIWYAVVVDALEATEPSADWQLALAAEWRSQATVRFAGVMTAELDRYVRAPKPRATLAALCRRLRDDLEGEALPPGPLTRRVSKDRWADDETRHGLLRIANAMLWLLGDDAGSRDAAH